MREREHLVINRETGGAVYATKTLPDADWDQRARELKASVPDAGTVAAGFFTVACNGCGRTVELDFDNPQLPSEWISREDGEFCPACTR